MNDSFFVLAGVFGALCLLADQAGVPPMRTAWLTLFVVCGVLGNHWHWPLT